MYSFYLDDMLLPIAPSKVQTKISNKNKTTILLDGTEINIIKKPGLTEIDFEFLLPRVNYPFSRYMDGFLPPEYFLEKIEKIKLTQKTFKFKILRSLENEKIFSQETDMKVSLEEYSITEDAKDGFDVKVSIKLKQFVECEKSRPVNYAKLVGKAVKKLIANLKKRSAKAKAKTYVVVEGDTLWGICKKELGDGSKYLEIAKLNGIQNPNLIKVGQVIRFE